MMKKFNQFSFTKHFKLFTILSVILISAGLIGLILSLFGVQNVFNFDIDFVGGTTFQFELNTKVDKSVTDHASELFTEALGRKPSSVTSVGDTGIRIKTLELSDQEVEAVRDAIANAYDVSIEKGYPSIFEPVSVSAVAMMVSEPPPSMLRAAPKKRLGFCSALASTPPVSTFPEAGATVL